MPLDTGRYLIRNVEHGNVIVLQSPSEGSMIVGKVPELDPHLKATEWNVVLLKNQHYLIQNYEHDFHVGATDPNDGKQSLHGSETLQRWVLMETAAENQYTISPPNQLESFWSLEDEDDGTLVTMSNHAMAVTSHWQFERVCDLESCLAKFKSDRHTTRIRGLRDLLRLSLQSDHLHTIIHDGGLAALIELTSDRNPSMKVAASETLSDLLQGVFSLLMVELHSWNPMLVQVMALNTVAELASMEDAQAAAVRCGMVPRLVRLLAAEDVTIQTKTLEALLAITTYEPAVDAAGKAGATEALEKIIEANGKAKTLATAVLKNLSEYTPPTEVLQSTEPRPEEEPPQPKPDDEIVWSMTTLVGQIEGKDISLWADAAFTLWNATAETIKAEAAIDVGVVAPLVKVLGSPETVTRRNAVGALRNLALRPRAQVILLELKVIPTFIKLLDHPDFHTRTNATGFIQHIAGNGVDAENTCLDAGVIPLLIKLLKSKDSTDLQNAGGAIWALTVHLAGQIKCYDAGAVPALARLLGNETALVRRNAVGSLQNITLHPPAQEALMGQHCLSALFKLFTDETDLIRQNASATIRNMTLHEPARAKVSDAGGLPVFIKMLYSDNATERNNAAGAIRNTTLYTGAQTVAVRGGIVAGFKSVLALSDTTAYSNAVAAIRTISLDQSAKEALLEGGMIPILVRMLKNEDDMTVVEHAAGALQNIALHVPAQVICLTSGAVPALAKQISTSTNTNVLLNSLGGLRNITLHEPARQVVLDAGSIPVLARLLENEDQGIRTATAGLMQNVTINAQAKEAALRAGAIPPLVKLIKSQDTTERTNAIGALWGISVHGPAQEVATDAGALSLLIPLLGSSYDITTRNYASGAIQNIALYSRAKLICVELGALPLLRDVVANSDITARTNAAIAVWSIAVYGDVAQKAILETGVIESLVAMMRECSGNAAGEANGQNKAVGALRSTFGYTPCRKKARSLGALPLLRQILSGGNTVAHEAARGAISDIEASTTAADDPPPAFPVANYVPMYRSAPPVPDKENVNFVPAGAGFGGQVRNDVIENMGMPASSSYIRLDTPPDAKSSGSGGSGSKRMSKISSLFKKN